MILNSLNFSLSFRDEFEECIERENTVDALMKTLEIASTKHPALVQFKPEDALFLINRLKNVIYDLVELMDEVYGDRTETPEELAHRRELIDQLSFYSNLAEKTTKSLASWMNRLTKYLVATIGTH